ncbi:hypothetical protein JY438_05105 [Stenotrophomonas maltophilia]|nr:hypothetical protein [Stenotrophomonas maltophilia]
MSNDIKTLENVQPGGRVRLGDALPPLPKMQRFTNLYGETYAYSAEQMRDYARAALSAQPSPGGQDAQTIEKVRAMMDHSFGGPGFVVYGTAQSIAEVERRLAPGLAARQPVGVMSTEASEIARGMVLHCIEHRLCMGMDEGFASFDPDVEHPFVQELREFADGARQPVGKHGEGDEFLAGICVALQCVTAQDSGVLWAEIVRAVGVDDLLQYATFIEPEEWDLAGFSTYASIELGRRKPRSKASKQAKRPPAQAVDLGRIRSTVQALLNWIDDWAETPEESGIDAIEIEAAAVLALIDSQGVGNG